jgi:tetratricopeptide (TPR) repeat protein
LEDSQYELELLAGLNICRARLADFRGSLAAAERYASLAKEFGGPREIVMAEWMLGMSYHLVGSQAVAQKRFECGFARAAEAGVSEVYSFGYDQHVRALVGYARTLWDRGLPDRAAQFGHRAIELAGRQQHPVMRCAPLLFATQVFMWRGDQQLAEDLIERLIAYADRYSVGPYYAGGLGLRGELMLARGETEAGIEALRTAVSALRTKRQFVLSSALCRALAEGLARTGQSAEATSIINAIVAEAKRGPGTFELPDLLRAQAAVLLAASPANHHATEILLKDSLDCARQQSALGRELRSALALSRLWADHGRVDEARTLLADVYGRFIEGFDTTDLREAARQLREFGEQAPHDRRV